MKNSTRLGLILLVGLVGVVSISEGKTVSSSKSKKGSAGAATVPLSPSSSFKPENAFLRLVKGVATSALTELREEGRRNPRFGMSFDFGNLTSLLNTNGTEGGGLNGTEGIAAIAALAGVPVAIKFSSLGVKGAIIGGLVGLKAFIIQVAITLLWLAFLISGTAYFVCNLGLVSCGSLGGGLGGAGGGGGGAGGLLGGLGSLGGSGGGGGSSFLGGSGGSSPFNFGGSGGSSGGGLTSGFSNLFSSRAGAAAAQQLQEQAAPIYKAIDDGYKKYQ